MVTEKEESVLFYWPVCDTWLCWAQGLIELCPDFSSFPARCQSSEGRYLSSWEVLEALEGQVGDQVSSVPDEWLMTSDDAGGGHNFAVPQAECLPLVQAHAVQVSINNLPSRKDKCSSYYHIFYWKTLNQKLNKSSKLQGK